MTKQFAVLLLTATFIAAPAFANESRHGDAAEAQAFNKEMQEQNAAYIKSSKPVFSKNWRKASSHGPQW